MRRETTEKEMDRKEKAGWLADKICNGGDYGKEAAVILVRQAEEIERLDEALRIASAAAGDLQNSLATLQKDRDNWREDALRCDKNASYWRGRFNTVQEAMKQALEAEE
jgi:hypothetical protein